MRIRCTQLRNHHYFRWQDIHDLMKLNTHVPSWEQLFVNVMTLLERLVHIDYFCPLFSVAKICLTCALDSYIEQYLFILTTSLSSSFRQIHPTFFFQYKCTWKALHLTLAEFYFILLEAMSGSDFLYCDRISTFNRAHTLKFLFNDGSTDAHFDWIIWQPHWCLLKYQNILCVKTSVITYSSDTAVMASSMLAFKKCNSFFFNTIFLISD
jgi:hypothetical protein